MVARLIQQLPLDSLGDTILSKLAKNDDANQLIACEVSLFSSDISLGNQVIAKTRGALQNLSRRPEGFSTWQQDVTEWRSYVLRRGDSQVVARTHVLEGNLTTADSTVRTGSLGLLTADMYCPDHLYYPQTVPVFGSAQSIPEPEKPQLFTGGRFFNAA